LSIIHLPGLFLDFDDPLRNKGTSDRVHAQKDKTYELNTYSSWAVFFMIVSGPDEAADTI